MRAFAFIAFVILLTSSELLKYSVVKLFPLLSSGKYNFESTKMLSKSMNDSRVTFMIVSWSPSFLRVKFKAAIFSLQS